MDRCRSHSCLRRRRRVREPGRPGPGGGGTECSVRRPRMPLQPTQRSCTQTNPVRRSREPAAHTEEAFHRAIGQPSPGAPAGCGHLSLPTQTLGGLHPYFAGATPTESRRVATRTPAGLEPYTHRNTSSVYLNGTPDPLPSQSACSQSIHFLQATHPHLSFLCVCAAVTQHRAYAARHFPKTI